MIADELLEDITRGREGKNQGYSTGLPKLDYLTDGSQDIKNTNLNNLLRT